MGWLKNTLQKIVGVPPTNWSFFTDLEDPSGSDPTPLEADGCYVELFVESARLEKASKFGQSFDGIVYSSVTLSREGAPDITVPEVVKPGNLSAIGSGSLKKVISVSNPITPRLAWRGGRLGVELGLFSVKSSNVLSEVADFVSDVATKAGVAVAGKVKDIAPLVTRGLDIIVGQKEDSEIEIAIDTVIHPTNSQYCAIAALPASKLTGKKISISPDFRLLADGVEIQAGYCVFSIRAADRNPSYGANEHLQIAFGEFMLAIREGRREEAQNAFASFSRAVLSSPDLITADQDAILEKAEDRLRRAFPASGVADAEDEGLFEKDDMLLLESLNLYGESDQRNG